MPWAPYCLILPSGVSSNHARFDACASGCASGDDGRTTVDRGSWGLTRDAGFGAGHAPHHARDVRALGGYYDAYAGGRRRSARSSRATASAFEASTSSSPRSRLAAFSWEGRRPAGQPVRPVHAAGEPGGVAAMSVPSGLSDGLPVGLQIMAPALADQLYRVGALQSTAQPDCLIRRGAKPSATARLSAWRATEF